MSTLPGTKAVPKRHIFLNDAESLLIEDALCYYRMAHRRDDLKLHNEADIIRLLDKVLGARRQFYMERVDQEEAK